MHDNTDVAQQANMMIILSGHGVIILLHSLMKQTNIVSVIIALFYNDTAEIKPNENSLKRASAERRADIKGRD